MKSDFNSQLIDALGDKQYTKIDLSKLTVILVITFTSMTWFIKIPILIGLRFLYKWLDKHIPHIILVLTARKMIKNLDLTQKIKKGEETQ